MPPAAPASRLDPALLERARRALSRRDPVLRPVIRRVGPCTLRARRDPYRELVRAVVYQQLAGAAASAIEGRLRGVFGGRIPAPAALLAAPEPTLRAVGLSARKVATLREIAEAFAGGGLSNRRLARMEDAAVVEAVTRIKGIGEWTAHMLLMFSLERPDVLPVGDYGVRKAARELYDLADLPKPAELEALAAPWRPFRSVACWYLWRHADVLPPE